MHNQTAFTLKDVWVLVVDTIITIGLIFNWATNLSYSLNRSIKRTTLKMLSTWHHIYLISFMLVTLSEG
jgi:hypothetical protein